MAASSSMEICSDEVDDVCDTNLKIVHLNDFCLEKIFRYLDLVDMANVAESNVRLAVPAESVFAQIHNPNHRLFLKFHGEKVEIPDWQRNKIDLYIVRNMFKHFGKHLKKIKFFIKKSVFYSLFNVIAEHCSNTLEELECLGFEACRDLCNASIPFVRLDKLIFSEIFTISYGPTLSDFNERFPNLRQLEFHNVRNIFTKFAVEQRFSHLEHFGIYIHPYASFQKEYFAAIRGIADLNPQMKSLGILIRSSENVDPPDDFLLVPMPNIERVEIGGQFLQSNAPFHFENLTRMKVGPFDAPHPISLPSQIKHLELLGFRVDDKLMNLLHQCPNLTVFSLIAFEVFNLDYVQQMTRLFPQVEEVEFITNFKEDPPTDLAFSALMIFIANCHNLRKATAIIRLDKLQCQYKIKKATFAKTNELLNSYREKLKQTFTFDWWRWPMKYEINVFDYIKGYRCEPSLTISLEKTSRN